MTFSRAHSERSVCWVSSANFCLASATWPPRTRAWITSSFSPVTASPTAAATFTSVCRVLNVARSTSGRMRICGPKATGVPSLVMAAKLTASNESALALAPILSSTTAVSAEFQGNVPSLRVRVTPSSSNSPSRRAWTSLPPWTVIFTWRRKLLDRMANCSSKASLRSSAV